MTCDHDTITADILEGDSKSMCVQWCQRCGSYRRGFNATGRASYWSYGDWHEPEGVETEEPENGWK